MKDPAGPIQFAQFKIHDIPPEELNPQLVFEKMLAETPPRPINVSLAQAWFMAGWDAAHGGARP